MKPTSMTGQLLAARQLLSSPAHWYPIGLAQSANHISVRPSSPKATRWSITGAILKQDVFSPYGPPIFELLSKLTAPLTIEEWDRSHSHAQVLALLDLAILLSGENT